MPRRRSICYASVKPYLRKRFIPLPAAKAPPPPPAPAVQPPALNPPPAKP